MLTTIAVSAPPQRRARTSAVWAGPASPMASGTTAKSPSTACRNGSCTSSECSWMCGPSAMATCGKSRISAIAAASTGTHPKGVSKASAAGAAMPGKAA